MSDRMRSALRYFDLYGTAARERAARDIETYRKGDARLILCDDAGTPLPAEDLRNASVEICLTNHAFRHGANLFMLDEFESEEQNREYRELFPRYCNLATLPFYWKDLEPEKGHPRYAADAPKIYRRPAPDRCLTYCLENGIEPKAHCLNYDYFRPVWLYGAGVEEHKAALDSHFRELAERYADRIPSWEVTNETFNLTFLREHLDQHYSAFYREDDFVPWSFRKAAQYFPNNRLIINDHLDFGCMRSLLGEFFNTRSPYYMQIRELLAMPDVRLDSIGFQFHSFFPREQEEELAVCRYNPDHLYHVLDTYHKLGLRLQITEMTLPAYSGRPEDEEVQAELLRALYTVFFSHPAMEAVIYWNLADGKAQEGENKYCGGLCRADLTEKPAGRVLRELFSQEWTTRETLTSAASGFAFRGFYGTYTARITVGTHNEEQTFTFRENGPGEITLKLR